MLCSCGRNQKTRLSNSLSFINGRHLDLTVQLFESSVLELPAGERLNGTDVNGGMNG